ncbi:hypothetical protein ACFQX7_02995 [Luedemannella flava]
MLRRIISWEIGMWRSLFRWILRRPPVVEPGGQAFPYVGAVNGILWAFIGVSTIEIPILHLMLPWETVRLIALALGIQGVLWMLGLMGSLKLHPHTVGPSGLRIRNSVTLDFTLRWDEIAAIRAHDRTLPPGDRAAVIEPVDGGVIAHLAQAGSTRVDVVLREPRPLPYRKTKGRPVVEFRFSADDPAALVAAARKYLVS